MKILSAYKDYYDYLTGIYGEDPILVLDRRKHKQPYISSEITKYQLWIGNYLVEFLVYQGEPYYGESIKSIPGVQTKQEKDLYMFKYWSGSYERTYGVPMDKILEHNLIEVRWGNSRLNHSTLLLKPIKLKQRPKFLSPEVVIAMGNYTIENSYYDYEYPILQDLKLNKFLAPEEVYKMIVEYLSEEKLKREQHEDLRTDIQKIEGKGFDKKTSFRPNIK